MRLSISEPLIASAEEGVNDDTAPGVHGPIQMPSQWRRRYVSVWVVTILVASVMVPIYNLNRTTSWWGPITAGIARAGANVLYSWVLVVECYEERRGVKSA